MPFSAEASRTDAEAHLSASAEGRAGGVRLEFDSICAVKSCNVHCVNWMHNGCRSSLIAVHFLEAPSQCEEVTEARRG